MASDNDKRLADWKAASAKYLACLDEMTEKLRNNAEIVPAEHVLKSLGKKSIVIEKAGKSFREDVNRAVDTEPQSQKSQYDDH